MCRDDPNFQLDLKSGKVKDCDWIRKKNIRKNKYSDVKLGKGYKSKVKFYCGEACGEYLPNRLKEMCGIDVPTTTVPSASPTYSTSFQSHMPSIEQTNTPSSIEPTVVPTAPTTSSTIFRKLQIRKWHFGYLINGTYSNTTKMALFFMMIFLLIRLLQIMKQN